MNKQYRVYYQYYRILWDLSVYTAIKSLVPHFLHR